MSTNLTKICECLRLGLVILRLFSRLKRPNKHLLSPGSLPSGLGSLTEVGESTRTAGVVTRGFTQREIVRMVGGGGVPLAEAAADAAQCGGGGCFARAVVQFSGNELKGSLLP